MDRRERATLAGSGLESESGNVRADGFFSVQVCPSHAEHIEAGYAFAKKNTRVLRVFLRLVWIFWDTLNVGDCCRLFKTRYNGGAYHAFLWAVQRPLEVCLSARFTPCVANTIVYALFLTRLDWTVCSRTQVTAYLC